KNLGRYVAEQVKEKNVMLVKGYCPVHEEMRVQEIQELKQQHPLAEVLAHPECNAAVLSIADYIGSTTGILKQAAASNAKEFIIATEVG
ncbi:quinolinate synthase NadA, partial [Erysipelatoclostridium ramosum]